MKQRNYNLKLGVLGAAALVIGGLLMALEPEAQTMRDSANGTHRSTHSLDRKDPRHDVVGNPMRSVSGSVPVSQTTTTPGMMREPTSTGDTRR